MMEHAELYKKINDKTNEFMRNYGKKYKLKKILCSPFFLGPESLINPVDIYFVVKTDKEKMTFEKEPFENCSDEYLDYVSKIEEFDYLDFVFFALSQEEIEKKYGGSEYNAML